MDGGSGHVWTCRVCQAVIETNGDGAVERITVPDLEALATAGDDEMDQRWRGPSEDEAAELLGELFRGGQD